MICPNVCYAVNPNDAKYCYKCGYEFMDTDRYQSPTLSAKVSENEI